VIVLAAHALFVRERWSFKLIWLMAFGAIAVAALLLAHQHEILGRFRYIDQPGTSIYFRLNAPSRLVADSLEEHPFGHAVGQTGYIASRDYYINWEQGAQTDIDNTLLLIVFYFGLLGILLNLAYLLRLVQFLVLKRHAIGLVMLSLLVALSTTGSGWAHHFALMIGYAVVVGRHLLANDVVARSPIRPAPPPLIRPPTGAARARQAAAGPHATRLRAAWRLAGGAA
jgi:hypothetical protein